MEAWMWRRPIADWSVSRHAVDCVHRPRPETLDELVHGALERGGTEAGDDDGEVRTRVESVRKREDWRDEGDARVAEGGGGWKTRGGTA